MQHQDGDIRRGDAADPAGLSEIFRLHFSQFLASFRSKIRDSQVVERFRNAGVFQVGLLLDGRRLQTNIARIFRFNFNLLSSSIRDFKFRNG